MTVLTVLVIIAALGGAVFGLGLAAYLDDTEWEE